MYAVLEYGASQECSVRNPASAGDAETRVCSLVQEDPLERGVTTHSSILAWRIPGTTEPTELQWESLRFEHH